MTDADCPLLARFLDKNSFVVSVDLRYNNITDEGARILANMLAVSVNESEKQLTRPADCKERPSLKKV